MSQPHHDLEEVPHVTLLGQVSFRSEQDHVSFGAELRYQLLAYLAVKHTWVSRDELATLLWSDTTSASRQNLRQLVLRVQKFPWLAGLEVERERLRWLVPTDLSLFLKALREGSLDQAFDLHTGSFLKSLEGYEDTNFANWVQLERERVHGLWRDVVLKGVDELVEQRQSEKALTLLRSILNEDELDEEVLALYLETARGTPLKPQARKLYQDFCRHLRRELDLEPSTVTTQLAQALEQDDPMPQASPARGRPALPALLTSFVGRGQELADASALLVTARLLTLTGPGGIGKTRLALETARAVSPQFTGGTAFVALAPFRTPDALATSIAEAIGLTLQGYKAPARQVTDFIGEQSYLLVLDNFEHLLEAAPVMSDLLESCPHLRALVTSRERLNVTAEWTLPVGGLSFPDEVVGVGEASSYSALSLFLERAKRVQPHFELTTEELPDVIAICQSVQGLPLAIELAAVWVRGVTCNEIAQAIRENLDFLSSSSRDVGTRHTSIRATFEYSWNLLTVREQEVFKRLSVFQGGMSREAATVVTGANGALLTALVDKSLLMVVAKGRYDLHPLLRQYAVEKLAEDDIGADETRASHAAFFNAIVGAAERELQGPGQAILLKTLELEHDNFRSALRWTQSEETAKHLQLLCGLWRFWWLHGYLREGRQWLESGLALACEDPVLRCQVFKGAGVLSWAQADFARAKALLEEGLELARTADEPAVTAGFLDYLALIAQEEDDVPKAVTLYEESLKFQRSLNSVIDRAVALNGLGLIAWGQGELDKARELLEESVTVNRELGDQASTAIALNNLGLIICDQGDYAMAGTLIREALAMRWELESRWGLASSFAQLACLSTAQGDFIQATYFWGKAEALREELGTTVVGIFLNRYLRDLAIVQQALDDPTLQAAWSDGRTADVADAVRIVLSS